MFSDGTYCQPCDSTFSGYDFCFFTFWVASVFLISAFPLYSLHKTLKWRYFFLSSSSSFFFFFPLSSLSPLFLTLTHSDIRWFFLPFVLFYLSFLSLLAAGCRTTVILLSSLVGELALASLFAALSIIPAGKNRRKRSSKNYPSLSSLLLNNPTSSSSPSSSSSCLSLSF